MDSITHACTGALLAELGMGRALGRRALAWGAVLGSLPDADVAAAPFVDGATWLHWHRGLSHSLLMVVVGGVAAGWLLRRRSPHLQLGRAVGVGMLCLASHVFLDLCTVYGTQILEPFSDARFGINVLFVIDPLFTVPLALATAVMAWTRSVGVRRAVGLVGLLAAGLYLGLAAARKHVVDARFAAALAAAGVEPDAWISAPTPFNTVVWYCVARRSEQCWIGVASVRDRATAPVRLHGLPRTPGLLAAVAGGRGARTAVWATGGYDVVRTSGGGVAVHDLRFGLVDLLADDGPPAAVDAVFRYEIDGAGDGLTVRRGNFDVGRGLEALWRRVTQ